MASGPSGAGAARSAHVLSDGVREELEQILATEAFAHSERQRCFLRFIVEGALRGQSDEVTEYVLGVEVFHRKPSFDPQTDAIVRVEASKLRHKLEQYYATEGRGHSLVIELPKRRYAPLFRLQQPPTSRVARAWTWVRSSHNRKIGSAAVILLLAATGAYWAAASRDLFGRNGSGSRPATPSARTPTPSLAEHPSIVVLPFTDLSANKDQEYLCDGLTEELIEALARLEGLRVVSRTSTFYFKGKVEDIRKIGAQLGVGMALEGSVRKVGSRLRIIAQLVNLADGYHLWSRTYEREAKEALAIPQEVASAIAATLRVELAAPHRPKPPAPYPRNPEANELYLKGLHFGRQWAESGLRQGIDYLEQAIRADPNYAPAYARLAECYWLLGSHGALPPQEVMPKAKAAAAKAIELNPAFAEAHASLGVVKGVYGWDWAGAGQEFQRALQLDPLDADIRGVYVKAYLVPRGRLEEALTEIQGAHTLDPVSPGIHSLLALIHYFRRQPDPAMEQAREALKLGPHFSAAYLALGLAYEQKSMFEEAVAAFQTGRAAWTGGLGESLLGHTYARMGKRDEARRLLEELQQLSRQRYVSGNHLALIYLGLDDKDRAMEWLEKAYEQHSTSLVHLKVDPRWDSLRSDPRFMALLKRIGLE